MAELLVFSLVEGWRGRSWQGIIYWTLRFRPVGMDADDTQIRLVRLHGTQPQELLEVRISCRQSPAFLMDSSHDSLARSRTAGEIMWAMYGWDRQGCMSVPATEFSQSVRVNCAEVQLKIRGAASLKLEGISVSAEVE